MPVVRPSARTLAIPSPTVTNADPRGSAHVGSAAARWDPPLRRIIHAVSHLWKVTEMRRYYKLRQIEFWLALATLLGVISIDVLPVIDMARRAGLLDEIGADRVFLTIDAAVDALAATPGPASPAAVGTEVG